MPSEANPSDEWIGLRARLERLEAHEAIRQLVNRYAVAVDARDIDTLAGLFVHDVDFGRAGTGPEGARAFFEAALSEFPLTILNVGTHWIELDDAEHGRGVVYCRGELEAGDEWVVQQIMYRDRYERRGGSWLFRSREHLLFYGVDVLSRPIGLPPAGKPELFKGRGSAPEVWPTFARYWERHGGRPRRGKPRPERR